MKLPHRYFKVKTDCRHRKGEGTLTCNWCFRRAIKSIIVHQI